MLAQGTWGHTRNEHLFQQPQVLLLHKIPSFTDFDSIKPAGEVNSFMIQLVDVHGDNVTSYYNEGLQVGWRARRGNNRL